MEREIEFSCDEEAWSRVKVSKEGVEVERRRSSRMKMRIVERPDFPADCLSVSRAYLGREGRPNCRERHVPKWLGRASIFRIAYDAINLAHRLLETVLIIIDAITRM